MSEELNDGAEIADSSPAAETEENQLNEVEQSSSAADSEEKKEKSNSFQKRINKLTSEKYELRQRLEELERKLSDQPKAEPKSIQSEVTDPPDPNEFDTDRDYQMAHAKYVADMAAKAALSTVENQAKERQQADAESERVKTLKEKKQRFDENVESKRSNFQDFEEVAYSHQFMDQRLAEMIFDSDKGPELAYHLGTHLDEAERIYRLSDIERVRELTKLEYSLPPVGGKRVSDAPDPIVPLDNLSEGVEKSPDDMSTDEWLEWRHRQLRKKRGN